MKPLDITLRLTAAFCLLAAVLVVVGWQGISHLRQFDALIQNIVYDRWQEQLLSHRAYRLSSENSQITLEIFLVDDPKKIQQLLAQRAANTQSITGLVDAIAPRLDTEKERELFAVVQTTRAPYLKSYQQALSLLLTQHKRDEARKMMVDVVQPNLAAYHNAWAAFNQYENDEIDQAIQQSNGEFVVGQRNFSLTLAFAGFMTGAIAIFMIMRMNQEMTVRHRAEASLQQAHDGLEQRILERTVDLRKANEMLQAEMIESRQKEEAVKRLAAIVENSDEAIISKTLSGRVTSWNPAAEKMFGYTESEMIGQTSQKVIPPDRLSEESEMLADFEKGVLVRHLETVRVRKNGQHFNISATISAIKDSDGKVVGISKIARDITERKRAEESLRLFESAVQQSKESIVITDTQLDLPGPRILFVNPAFTQMTGYTAEEALGKTPRILQGLNTDKTVLNRLRKSLERGEVFEGETVNYRKDGRQFDLEWQIAPLRDTGGKVTHFVAIQHDITGRKRLESQLLQSQKMETVGKLAGGIAHEFNSILTAIIGQSELLIEDLPAESPLTRNAAEISKAASRAATLTRQLLAYGRKQILQPEILDLNAIMVGMEGTLRHVMGVNGDVRLIPAAGLKAIKADAGQIEQVIMNLAINAHDAMPNGGKLTLETANVDFVPDSMAPYPELKPGNYVMLAITDTGTGMSADAKSQAFEPFFSTKAVGEGTGLGLSTCYGIIKQSGGHISVYSEKDQGTTFKIYLPQTEQEVKPPIPQLDPLKLPRGTETILLVEDDPGLRDMAATLLGRLGYTVLTAANGIEALNLKQQHNGDIDLLFTDIVMPHMSGKELSDQILVLYPHTKILFTSAYTENAIIHQGMLKKGVALLQKPFTPSVLARKMREVLDQPARIEP